MSFRDLQRTETQLTRYQEYKKWQALTPEQRSTAFEAVSPPAQRAKHARTEGLVSPFNTTGSTLVYITANVLSLTQTGVGSNVATLCANLCKDYIKPTNTANAIIIEADEYKFAKLSLTEVVPATSKSTSRITKSKYFKPSTNTATCPFGQKTAGDDYATVIAAIQADAAFTTFKAQNDGKNRFKFIPEGA